ncbi:hypothetical protein IG631_21176 [Alternaria alternata]|nr:hypothetical protein IG631_21176 [Alternaria alternata]
MPSTPYMQSSLQASDFLLKKQDTHEYRQTTYHDGSNVQIAESRRHRWADWKVEPPVQGYTDFVLYPKGDEDSYSQSSFEQVSSQSHPAPRRKVAEPSSELHVTYAKRSSKVRSKSVILHTEAKSSEGLLWKTKTAMNSFAGPTPPPTPRLSRLSTPEFDDMDEAPFCGCDVEAHVVKRCTKCRKEVGLW